jgi:cytochrome c oxidase subunit IV
MTEQVHPHPHPRPYGLIFIALFALTVVEIFTSDLHLPKHFIVIALVGLAIVKAALVGLFYMHLKFEKALLYVIALSPLIFSFIMAAMVGWDIGKVR